MQLYNFKTTQLHNVYKETMLELQNTRVLTDLV